MLTDRLWLTHVSNWNWTIQIKPFDHCRHTERTDTSLILAAVCVHTNTHDCTAWACPSMHCTSQHALYLPPRSPSPSLSHRVVVGSIRWSLLQPWAPCPHPGVGQEGVCVGVICQGAVAKPRQISVSCRASEEQRGDSVTDACSQQYWE